MYNFAWYKDPIVNGLIMNSGTAFIETIIGSEGPRFSNFSYVASQVGCGNKSSAQEELACMKNVDAAALEQILAESSNGVSTANLVFGPPADGKLVFSNYTERTLQGKLTKVASRTLSDGTQDNQLY
jgi:hypothetical protein